jgi:hypothetical protein
LPGLNSERIHTSHNIPCWIRSRPLTMSQLCDMRIKSRSSHRTIGVPDVGIVSGGRKIGQFSNISPCSKSSPCTSPNQGYVGIAESRLPEGADRPTVSFRNPLFRRPNQSVNPQFPQQRRERRARRIANSLQHSQKVALEIEMQSPNPKLLLWEIRSATPPTAARQSWVYESSLLVVRLIAESRMDPVELVCPLVRRRMGRRVARHIELKLLIGQ